MSEPSICGGCRYALWDQDENGRGICTSPESPLLRILAAFHIPKSRILGGQLNRSDKYFVVRSCDFREAAP